MKVESKKRNAFNMGEQKKNRKEEKQKNDALTHIQNAMKTFPLVLRMRVLEISRLVQLGQVRLISIMHATACDCGETRSGPIRFIIIKFY